MSHYSFPTPFCFLNCSINSLYQALFLCPSDMSNSSSSWSSLRNKVKLVFRGLYLAWLCRTNLIFYKTMLPAFCKDKMFFVSYSVVILTRASQRLQLSFLAKSEGIQSNQPPKEVMVEFCSFVVCWFVFFSFIPFLNCS